MAEANEQINEANEEASALVVKTQSKNDERNRDKGGRFKKKQGRRSRDKDECHLCKEIGHWARDCPQRKGNHGNDRGDYGKTTHGSLEEEQIRCSSTCGSAISRQTEDDQRTD